MSSYFDSTPISIPRDDEDFIWAISQITPTPKSTANHVLLDYAKAFGLALDKKEKRRLSSKEGIQIPEDPFSPFDFSLYGVEHDIKSSSSLHFSISHSERKYILECLRTGKSFNFVLFCNDFGEKPTSTFRLMVDATKMLDEGLIRLSQHPSWCFEDGEWKLFPGYYLKLSEACA